MTTELADELAALDAKATPGPWGIWFEQIDGKADKAIAELIDQVHSTDPIGNSLVMLDADGKCPAITGCGPTSAHNAALIVALRNNLPAIIAALTPGAGYAAGIEDALGKHHFKGDQSDVRMRFNEAIAGGPNMEGDSGWIIHTNGHAADMERAIKCIAELRASLPQPAPAEDALRTEAVAAIAALK